MKIFFMTLCFFSFAGPVTAMNLAQNFNFDGVLTDSSDLPITTPVSLKFQIFDPSESCLLFEETHPAVAPDPTGHFSVKVGTGTRASNTVDGGLLFKEIFQNSNPLRAGGTPNCAPGYTPGAPDGRKLRVTVGSTVLTPSYDLSPVPMATVAETLQGKSEADFIQTNATFPQTINNNLKVQGTFQLLDTGGVNSVGFSAPSSLAASLNWTLPSADGTSGQVLSTNGAGALSWITPSGGGGGTVTGISGASPIAVDNTNPATPVVSLSDSGVSAGTYGSATEVPMITVDSKGRITSVTNQTIADSSPAGTLLSMEKVWLGNASNMAQEAYINASNLKKSDGTSQFPATCNSSQTLTWTSLTDAFTCTNISLTTAEVSGLDTALDGKVDLAGDTMTGLLNLPADGLNVGGSQLVVNGGNTGIGTSTPLAALEVSAMATSYGQLVIKDPNNYSSDLGLKNFIQGNDNSDNPVWRLGVVNNAQNLVELAAWDNFHAISLTTNNASRLIVTPTGQVGIGTMTPQARLQVMGAIVSGYMENSSSTNIDWATGNVQTANTCTSFYFNSMVNGGIYKLVVNDSSTLTACTFTDSGGSRILKYPGNAVGLNGVAGVTAGSNPTLVTFTVTSGMVLVEATSYNSP